MRILTTVIAALLLAACSNPDTPEILAAKSEIAVLYDPDSAIFRLPPMQNEITERGGVYCGMVNAKNRYGGMTGFKPFAAYLHANEELVHARKHDIAALDGDDEASTWRFC